MNSEQLIAGYYNYYIVLCSLFPVHYFYDSKKEEIKKEESQEHYDFNFISYLCFGVHFYFSFF